MHAMDLARTALTSLHRVPTIWRQSCPHKQDKTRKSCLSGNLLLGHDMGGRKTKGRTPHQRMHDPEEFLHPSKRSSGLLNLGFWRRMNRSTTPEGGRTYQSQGGVSFERFPSPLFPPPQRSLMSKMGILVLGPPHPRRPLCRHGRLTIGDEIITYYILKK